MNPVTRFFLMLAVMAGTTYLVRMLPFVLCRRKLTNRYLLSFLYYIPYTVLAAMTVPAVLYSTGSLITAIVGIAVAVLLAYRKQSLLIVAACASVAAFIAALVLRFV